MSEDIAELGLRVDSRQVRQADRDLDDFSSTATKTSKKVDLLTSALKLMASAFAALKLVKLIEETALLNARFETMGVVMNVAGNNAGYTSAQMSELEKELQKTGISMIKARENLTSLATANIDLSKATKLARAAQDLAVVGNVNSSEAFSRLTQGIKSGEVEVLRTLGLNVNFENSYKKLASQLGITSDRLTEQQKVQARTNATLEAASRYTGIYEESMGTAGKQIQSLSRYIEDAKVKAGELFNDSLTNIVGRLTEALKAANAELDKMGSDGSIDRTGQNLAKVVDLISKSILTLGGVLAWLYQRITTRIGEGVAYFQTFFTTIMNGLNALARAVNGLFENGWGNSKTVLKGLSDAYEEVKKGVQQTLDVSDGAEAQYEAQDAALGAYVDKLWKQVDATKAVTQEDEEMRKRKEAQRIAAGVAARAEEEAEAKKAAAREAAAKALKKLQEEAASFYKSSTENSKERIAIAMAELNSTVELTNADKDLIKTLTELDRVRKGLKPGQAKQIQQDAEAAAWLENLNEAIEKNKKARKDQVDAALKDVDAAITVTKGLQDQVTYYGMTTDAVLRLQAAEMDREIAQAQFRGDEIEIERLQILQSETIKQADLQLKLNRMKAATQFWTDLEQAAHQTFLSIANGNKDLWTRLKETAKNIFFEWLYQQTLKKWIINIGMSSDGAGAVSGIAGALGGGSSSGSGGLLSAFSSGGNLLSIGKMIYSGFSSGIASSLGSSISSLGSLFGSEAVSAFGAGMSGGALGASTASVASGYAGTTAAGFGASAASAIPIIGWIIAGMQAANGFAKQGFTPNNGTIDNVFAKAFTSPTNMTNKALEKLGVGSSLANILSGAAINTKLFGRADPRVESQGVRGTISAAGVDAESYANIIEKGGIFRSSKRYQKTAELATETDKAWDNQISTMIAAVKEFGSVLGIQTDAINAYTKSFDIKLTGDETKDNEAIAALFASVGDELSTVLVPSLAQFQAEGEALSATLQRVTGNYAAVDAAFTAIGKSMGVVGVAGITARENLIAAAGGLETLVSGISYFQQNLLTEAQQLAPVQKHVTEQLAAMGWSSITTAEQFAAAGLAIDTSTEAGAKLFAQMLELAPAFKTVADAATAKAAAAAEEYSQVLNLQAQTYEATGDKVAAAIVLEKQRVIALEKLSPALQQATKDLWAAQDAAEELAAATQREAERAAAAAALWNQEVSRREAAAEAAKEMNSAIESAIAYSLGLAKSLRDLNVSLQLGSTSALSKASQYELAKSVFMSSSAADLQQNGQAFLAASKARGGSELQYAIDFAAVIARNAIAAAQQTALADRLPTMFAGSHKDGLDYVPYDNYPALLHEGESVRTKSQTESTDTEQKATNRKLDQLISIMSTNTGYAKKQSDVLQGVTRGGTSLAVEEAT